MSETEKTPTEGAVPALSGIDHLFLAIKLRIYQNLAREHLEEALHLIRELSYKLSDELKPENSQEREAINLYLYWLRGNYFHLVTDRPKASDNYAQANNIIEKRRSETRHKNKEPDDDTINNFLGGLLSSDIGDFHWYSSSSDLAALHYDKAISQLGPIISNDIFFAMLGGKTTVAYVDDCLSKIVAGSRSKESLCSASDKKDSNDETNSTKRESVADDDKKWRHLLGLKLLYMDIKKHRLDGKGNLLKIASSLELLDRNEWLSMPFIPFMVGQHYATIAPKDWKTHKENYVKAQQHFLAAICGKIVTCPEYLFEAAPLTKILNDRLLKRAASYYLLCKLLKNIPVDESGMPSSSTEESMEKAHRELREIKCEIHDFVASVDHDVELVAFLEFLKEARQWVAEFILPSGAKPNDKLLNNKISYLISNAHFFLHDFVNRKREFEGDIYAKLFTPAINVVPRCGNVFSVLRRWNSASPVIMRTRKVAVAQGDHGRPEDLKLNYDLRCHGDHHPESKGGGYFLRWNGYGIVIDPGIFFFENFLEYYSISDINLVIISHDHPDHSIDIKSLFMLLVESAQRGKSRAPIDFWIDPGSSSEFYSYILNLQAKEETREQQDKAKGTLKPRLIGNVYPYYKDVSQSSPNKPNIWTIAEKGIHIRAIYNEKHWTISMPKQSFGILVSLYNTGQSLKESKDPNQIIYITGDGGFDENVVKQVTTALGGNKIDILVAHVGSLHELDLTNTTNFDKGIYETHLGMRGVVELVDRLKPDITVVSEYGEEMNTFRKRFCSMIDFHRISRLGRTECVQEDSSPRAVIPGDIGLTFWLHPDKPDENKFVCRLCFDPHPLNDMRIHTSGQVLFYVCSRCEKALFRRLDDDDDDGRSSRSVALMAESLLS